MDNSILTSLIGSLISELENKQKEIQALKSELQFYKQKSETDHLTGLKNRRRLEDYIMSYLVNDTPFSLILADIDDFKKVNDEFGHNTGDTILKKVANILKDNVVNKHNGKVFRYGGEEFLIILPVSDPDEVKDIYCEIRDYLLKCTKEIVSDVTLTYGCLIIKNPLKIIEPICDDAVATICKEQRVVAPLIEMADKLLYEGKKSGKDVIIIKEYNENEGVYKYGSKRE